MYNEIEKGLNKRFDYPGTLESLGNKLTSTELNSFLIELFHKKANELKSHNVFSNFQSNQYVKSSSLDPLLVAKFDVVAFELLPKEFQRIELSPLSPFGVCSSLATVSQKKVISSIRNTEVTADATNVLCLEAAIQRKKILIEKEELNRTINLAASHRVVRMQPTINKEHTPHFKLFNLCSAGKDTGNKKFEIQSAILHLEYYISLLYKTLDWSKTKEVEIRLLNYNKSNTLIKSGILRHFASRPLEKIHFMVDQKDSSGVNYYIDLRVMINITNSKKQKFHIIDGGYTDWTRKILSNKKERVFTSCIGTELFLKTMDLKEF